MKTRRCKMERIGFDLNKVTDEIRQSTHGLFGDRLQKIILFGSYARGDYTEESDIDIMVLADVDENECWPLERKLCKIASDASLEHDITICMILNDWQTFTKRLSILPFNENVMTEGIEIYGK
jgi:predicted nucleotidyltransferase